MQIAELRVCSVPRMIRSGLFLPMDSGGIETILLQALFRWIQRQMRLPPYAQIDMSIAMENLWLETDAQGLGSVWLGIAPMEDRMKAVEEIIGMPADLHAFGLFPLGYACIFR